MDGDEWEKGERSVKPRDRHQPRRPRLPWTAARTTKIMLRQSSVRHCAATTAPPSCCPNCYAEHSHKDSVNSSAVGKQMKRKKSNSQAQLHLPALDLFWANLRVQHHLPPLDLSWTRLVQVSQQKEVNMVFNVHTY